MPSLPLHIHNASNDSGNQTQYSTYAYTFATLAAAQVIRQYSVCPYTLAMLVTNQVIRQYHMYPNTFTIEMDTIITIRALIRAHVCLFPCVSVGMYVCMNSYCLLSDYAYGKYYI